MDDKKENVGLSLELVTGVLHSLDLSLEDKQKALDALAQDPETPPAELLTEGGSITAQAAKELPPESQEALPEKESGDVRIRLSKLGVGGKIKAALLGNASCRAILIRDTNKVVQLCVLKNPRISQTEIEDFAGNPNLTDQVLRVIGNTSGWMKSPRAKLKLVGNPKTPLDLAVRWLKYLGGNDIKNIARSKSIPSAIVNIAKKMVTEQQK